MMVQSTSLGAERTANDDIPTTFDDDRAGGKHHFVPKVTDALKK